MLFRSCLEISSGEYIAVQDADDYSRLDRIKVEVDFLEKNNKYALVCSRMYLFDEKGMWGERGLKNYSPTKEDLIKSNKFMHPTAMIRRQSLKEVGGYTYNDNTYRGEDYDLWFKLYSKGKIGYVIDKKLYYFKEDKQSYNRKKFAYRIDEMKLKINGCNIMKVNKIYYIHALKPILVGIVPKSLLRKYHRIKYK